MSLIEDPNVGFHKAKKKERKKRPVEDGRMIFRATVYRYFLLFCMIEASYYTMEKDCML